MRAYVVTTGFIFGLLVVAHLWRLVLETHLATDPVFVLFTVISAALAMWAWRVSRALPPAKR